jgi:hypothetical protein
MKRQHTHTDGALLPRRYVGKRAQILLGAKIELTSSFVKLLFDAPTLDLMLLAVFVLTLLVAIPNTLTGRTLLEGITLLSALRTEQFG